MAQLFDVDVFGRENINGDIKPMYGDDALGNSLKFWLTSKKGDDLFNPDRRGVLDTYTFKLLSNENLASMSFELKNAINDNFGAVLSLISLRITPDYENRMWAIDISYRSLLSGQVRDEQVLIEVKEKIKTQTQSYIDVPLVDSNLENFILLKQDNFPNERLLYDSEIDFWLWGGYKFINFTVDSDNFDYVFSLINGEAK